MRQAGSNVMNLYVVEPGNVGKGHDIINKLVYSVLLQRPLKG